MRVVVVGCGVAGAAAARAALASGGRCSVLVLEKRRYAAYHPCSLIDAIAGDVPLSALVEGTPGAAGLEVRTATLVEEVDVGGRRLTARDLRTGGRVEVEYDALVLATGSKPHVPRGLRIEDSSGVFTLKTVEDAERILSACKHGSAVVVGGGPVGVEVAHALRRRGLRVTLLEALPRLLPGRLDAELSRLVEDFLRAEGVELALGRAAVEVRGDLGDVAVTDSGGATFRAGFVVLATGFKPDAALARDAGLELGPLGGVRVDDRMRASGEAVYAAGDVAEVRNAVTGKPMLALSASVASITGRVAGANAAGGDEAFRGAVRSWIVSLGGLRVGAVGLTEGEAAREGLDPMAATVTVQERPPFYPGAGWVTVKLVAEAGEGRLIGVQAAGRGGVDGLLNVASLAVLRGATVRDLLHFEHAYAPSLSDLHHPLHAAAEAVLRRMAHARRQGAEPAA